MEEKNYKFCFLGRGKRPVRFRAQRKSRIVQEEKKTVPFFSGGRRKKKRRDATSPIARGEERRRYQRGRKQHI